MCWPGAAAAAAAASPFCPACPAAPFCSSDSCHHICRPRFIRNRLSFASCASSSSSATAEVLPLLLLSGILEVDPTEIGRLEAEAIGQVSLQRQQHLNERRGF